MSVTDLHEIAVKYARRDAEEYVRDGRPFGGCGFAWVEVYGVKLSTKVGKEFAKVGFRKNYGGGLRLSNPSGLATQDAAALLAGAEKYAEIFRNAGYTAYAVSRMD